VKTACATKPACAGNNIYRSTIRVGPLVMDSKTSAASASAASAASGSGKDTSGPIAPDASCSSCSSSSRDSTCRSDSQIAATPNLNIASASAACTTSSTGSVGSSNVRAVSTDTPDTETCTGLRSGNTCNASRNLTKRAAVTVTTTAAASTGAAD